MRHLLIILLAVPLLAACPINDPDPSRNTDAASYSYQQPESIDDGWPVASLASEGLEEASFVELVDAVNSGEYGEVDGIVVARRGKLVFEAYFNGYERESWHQAWSVTKSVVSMLVGVAARKGYLSNLHATVLPLFPEYSPYGEWDDRKGNITIEHLLTMSTGLDCDDTQLGSYGRESILFASQDWVKHFLHLRMLRDPGAEFRYCAGSVVALSGVIEKYSGQSPIIFAREHLLDPLDIQATWVVGPKGRLHANGLSIRPRDMAKLGQVMLDGTWNGQVILDTDWIEASTSHQIVDADGESAGYLWWRSVASIQGVDRDIFFALGAGGQGICVLPSHDMVVVFTGNNFNETAIFQMSAMLRLITLALQSQ